MGETLVRTLWQERGRENVSFPVVEILKPQGFRESEGRPTMGETLVWRIVDREGSETVRFPLAELFKPRGLKERSDPQWAS